MSKEDRISLRTITIPNFLSLLRIVLIPIFIYFYLDQQKVLALGILFLASITDFLDGIAARVFNQRSKLGYILDPLADKLLMDSTYILFTLRALPLTLYIPKWLTITIVSRDVILILGAAIMTLFNPNRVLRPHWVGKITTSLQMFTAILVLFVNVSGNMLPGFTWLFRLTGVFTVVSGFYYVLREIGNI